MKHKEEHKKVYKTLKFIFKPFFVWYYKMQFENKEVIPAEGPIIICANHKHLFDQFLPISSTNRMLHYLAKKEYFDDWRKAWFFKITGCIPVNRQIKDTAAKERAMGLLEQGYAVGIFPEGTRNRTKELLLPFKFGAVSMAQKTNATIVPAAIVGDYKFRSGITVRYGKPFKVGKMSLEEANEKLRNEIAHLLTK